MALSVVGIQAAKPLEKEYKLADERGLYLAVTPKGRKHWRFKYRIGGKEKKLSFGSFPDVGLADARAKRDEARKLVAAGVDPSLQEQEAEEARKAREEQRFDFIADEWLERLSLQGRAEATITKMRWMVDFARPSLGSKVMSDITAPEVLSVLRKIEAKGRYETANRARSTYGTIFRYAVATGRATRDVCFDLRGALITPKPNHRAAIIEPKQVGALLRAIDHYDGLASVRLALMLLAHVFVRPGELRLAEWKEFDLEGKVWTIPAERTKMRRPHRVPLSRQSLALLVELESLQDGASLVFPSIRSSDRAISDNTLNAALRRLGYDQSQATAHGFRATASTLLNESGKWHPDAIERQLSHVESNDVRRAYLRGEHWDERVRMMKWWSDYLEKLRTSGNANFRREGRRSMLDGRAVRSA